MFISLVIFLRIFLLTENVIRYSWTWEEKLKRKSSYLGLNTEHHLLYESEYICDSTSHLTILEFMLDEMTYP